MMLPAYLKPVIGAVVVVALGAGYYWVEHRPRPQETVMPNKALVVVAKAVNACFSDLVRVTGFVVPRREAIVGVDQEGSKVTDLLVREGDLVTENQELARLTAPPANPQNPGAKPGPVSLRAPAAGLVTEVHTIVGAPASPQAGPMFRIAVNNEIELDAEVPGISVPASVIERVKNAAELAGIRRAPGFAVPWLMALEWMGCRWSGRDGLMHVEVSGWRLRLCIFLPCCLRWTGWTPSVWFLYNITLRRTPSGTHGT